MVTKKKSVPVIFEPTCIIIKNTKEKTCTLIDVAITTDRNVVQKEAGK